MLCPLIIVGLINAYNITLKENSVNNIDSMKVFFVFKLHYTTVVNAFKIFNLTPKQFKNTIFFFSRSNCNIREK